MTEPPVNISKDTEVENEVSPLEECDDTEKAVIYGLYSQLKAHKDHFSAMQMRYRTVTSTWLLAAFAGFGFILAQHGKELPLNPLLALCLLSFCASIGLAFLWHLDIVLYRKLWWAAVVELAASEAKHTWLSRVNLNIISSRSQRSFRWFQSVLYIGCIDIFIIVMSASGMLYAWPNWRSLLVIGGVELVALIGVPIIMLHYGAELVPFDTDSFLPMKED